MCARVQHVSVCAQVCVGVCVPCTHGMAAPAAPAEPREQRPPDTPMNAQQPRGLGSVSSRSCGGKPRAPPSLPPSQLTWGGRVASDAGQCALRAGAARRGWSESGHPPVPPAAQLPSGDSPDSPVLVQRLPTGDHGVPIVTGTASGWHTLALIIQEGAVGAGTAVHGHKADAAGDVLIAAGPAGGLAGADVVLVGHGRGAGVHGLRCRTPGRGWHSERCVPGPLACHPCQAGTTEHAPRP